MWGKLFLTAFMLLSAPKTHAADMCERLFTTHHFGQILPNFEHNAKYTKEALDQTPIKNQCGFATCQIFAMSSRLEQAYKYRTGKTIKISTDYLNATSLYRNTLRALRAEDNKSTIDLRLSFGDMQKLFSTFGIIPSTVWSGSRSFYSYTNAGKTIGALQNIVGHFKNLRDQAPDAEKKKMIIELGEEAIANFFADNIGVPPDSFQFDGVEYTPQTFRDKFFPEINKPMIQILVSPDGKVISEGNNITMEFSALEETIQKLIDQNQDVYVTYQVNDQFIDLKSGIMSVSAFGYESSQLPLSRSVRVETGDIFNGLHAALIVGYDKDPVTKKIIKWKIKNSYGEHTADGGYFHMYQDYFEHFVIGIAYSP